MNAHIMSSCFATPWTVAYEAPLSMGFLRQEYWSGLPFPSPGDRPDSGIDPRSPTLQEDFFLSLCHQGSFATHGKLNFGLVSGISKWNFLDIAVKKNLELSKKNLSGDKDLRRYQCICN